MASKMKTAVSHDPLTIVGEGLGAASDSIKAGAEDVKNVFVGLLPKVTRLAAQAVYSTFYAASFGVTYSAVVFEEVVPLDNPVGYGLRDGAKAARDSRA